MSFSSCLLVALGGALGTLARYALSVLTVPVSRELPIGTIAINVIGSLIIGFFGTLTLSSGRYPVPENMRLFVMVGLCGGFTTFSAFSLQTLELARDGRWPQAAANVALSLTLCLAAVAAGHYVAQIANAAGRSPT